MLDKYVAELTVLFALVLEPVLVTHKITLSSSPILVNVITFPSVLFETFPLFIGFDVTVVNKISNQLFIEAEK